MAITKHLKQTSNSRLGTRQLQQKRACSKRSPPSIDMARSNIPILLALGHSHIPSCVAHNVRIALQVLDFPSSVPSLDFNVPLADFTKKYIPWRENLESAEDNVVHLDSICLYLCLHQSAGSESSAEDPDILRSYFFRKYLVVKFMDCWNLGQPSRELVHDTILRYWILCCWTVFHVSLLQVSSWCS